MQTLQIIVLLIKITIEHQEEAFNVSIYDKMTNYRISNISKIFISGLMMIGYEYFLEKGVLQLCQKRTVRRVAL